MMEVANPLLLDFFSVREVFLSVSTMNKLGETLSGWKLVRSFHVPSIQRENARAADREEDDSGRISNDDRGENPFQIEYM